MVVLWRAAGPEAPRRAGFAVSRQIRGAVARNRARRRLREAYRASRSAAPAHVDIVVIARAAALTAPMTKLSTEMQRALSAIPSERPRS